MVMNGNDLARPVLELKYLERISMLPNVPNMWMALGYTLLEAIEYKTDQPARIDTKCAAKMQHPPTTCGPVFLHRPMEFRTAINAHVNLMGSVRVTACVISSVTLAAFWCIQSVLEYNMKKYMPSLLVEEEPESKTV